MKLSVIRLLLPAMALSWAAVSWAAAPAGAASTSASSAASPAAKKPASGGAPTNEDDKMLYELGVLMSGSLDPFNFSDKEFKQVINGLNDGYHHKADLEAASAYQQKIGALQRTRMLATAEKQKQLGQAYLDKAAATPGAAKLANGVVYIPLVPGNGATPTPKDQVKVKYTGKLIDGTVFDSSKQHNDEPAVFGVSGVIPCFGEALPMMKVGGKSRIVCPADQAYGDRGRLPKIQPGATLDFEVELLETTTPAPSSAIPDQQGPDRAAHVPPAPSPPPAGSGGASAPK